MPNTPYEFSVLISSPSDLLADRDAIEETIEELSRLLVGRNIRLRPLRWERDVVPGIGHSSVQDVIDSQTSAADLLVATIGRRLGSAASVGTVTSGTVSEILSFVDRDDRRFGGRHVQVYLRNEAIPISEMDIDELARVKAFREELSSRKVLYREYTSTVDLQAALRIGLVSAVDAFERSVLLSSPVLHPAPSTSDTTDESSVDADMGYIDYVDMATENLTISNGAVERSRYILQSYGKSIEGLTNEIIAAAGDSKKERENYSRAAALMKATALEMVGPRQEMDSYATKSFDALRKAIRIVREDSIGSDLDAIVDLRNSVFSAEQTYSSVIASASGFTKALSALPRLTKEVNVAKRLLMSETSETVEAFDRMRVGTRALREELDALIAQRRAS